MTHIAGFVITIGSLIRQRCGWCGVLLIDYDLDRIAVPEGTDPSPAVWHVGELVRVDGILSTAVPHDDGEVLPGDACARLDPAVTV